MSYTKNHVALSPRRSRKAVWLAAGLSFLAVNAIAALVVRSYLDRRGGVTSEGPAAAIPPMAVSPSEGGASADDPARAHRLAGLDHMDRREFAEAVSALTNAVRAGDDSPELLRLLALAQDFRARGEAGTLSPIPDERAREARSLVGAVRSRPARRAAASPSVSSVSAAARESPREGALGRAETNSMREEAPRELVTTRDVASAPPPPAPSGPTLAETLVRADSSGQAGSPSLAALPRDPAPSPSRLAPPPPPAPRPAPARVGELEVVSPNVFGDVWVNGRNHGPAPRVVRDVPVGTARVEIRVGATVRRTKAVSVSEGSRARVQLL